MPKLSTETTKRAGMNSGAETLAKLVKLSDIRLHSDFESLFMIKPAVLAQVVSRMKKYGYDKSQPIHIWKEKNILIDGHTRLRAAIDCGMFDIPAYEHSFKSVEDALEYALGLQTARRNLTDAEIVNAIGKLDQLKQRGRTGEDEEQYQAEKGKSAEQLAKVLGTSTSKIERVRAIEKKASAEVKNAVATGEMSIYSAYQNVKATKPIETKGVSEQITKGATSMEKELEKVKAIQLKETTEYPCFSLAEIVDALCRRKYYTLAFLLFEDLKVDIELQKHFVKTMPEDIQKSFALDKRMKA